MAAWDAHWLVGKGKPLNKVVPETQGASCLHLPSHSSCMWRMGWGRGGTENGLKEEQFHFASAGSKHLCALEEPKAQWGKAGRESTHWVLPSDLFFRSGHHT